MPMIASDPTSPYGIQRQYRCRFGLDGTIHPVQVRAAAKRLTYNAMISLMKEALEKDRPVDWPAFAERMGSRLVDPNQLDWSNFEKDTQKRSAAASKDRVSTSAKAAQG